jgi:ferredoxin-NADP reductase
VTFAYTRRVPEGWTEPARRIDGETILKATWPPDTHSISYVCGPTAFVESAADLLRSAGHDAALIKTERFGPSGGS